MAEALPYGENNVDLPEELVDALTELVRERQNNEQFVRRREVLRDRRNRYYERGFQHLHENERAGTFVQMQAGQSYTNSSGQLSWCPNYIDDYNLFAPCLEILIAILTQNSPGIDFRPINPNLTEHMDAATAAEGYRKMFDRANDPKQILVDLTRMMGVSGRTVIWTRTEADAQKYGYDDAGNPHKMETATVYGTLESRVPVLAKSLSDCGFVVLFDDPDVTQARAKYPAFKDEIKANMAGIGESAYERMARLGVLQGTRLLAQMGDSFNHLCTRAHVWLRPSEFEADSLKDGFRGYQKADVTDDGKIPTIGEKLKQIFPSGCHITFIGDKYVGSWDESMDDHLTIDFPLPGDGMSRQAIMDRAVVFQDRYNDDRNAYAECKDMGWPSTWINGDEGSPEFDAIAQQRADPYAIRPAKARAGEPLASEFFREPDPMLPNSFTADTEELVQMLYFVLGTPPAVFGEGETDQKLMDVNELIPTPEGFVRNGDLKDGSIVFGQDGKQYPVLKAHHPTKMQAYRVTFDDGTSTHVHGGHLWTTFDYSERRKLQRRTDAHRAKVKQSRKSRGTGAKPWLAEKNRERAEAYTPEPVTGTVRTTEEILNTLTLRKARGSFANHAIEIPSAVKLPHRDLPIDPYCLGAWLGDGNKNGGSHFTASDTDGPDILKHFEAAGYKTKRLKSPNDWSVLGLKQDLRKAGVLRDKHIPIGYLWASEEQRLAVLQGLMDTDGNCSKAGRARFTNTNIELSLGVYHLAASLGLKPFFRAEEVELNGVECATAYWVEWTASLPVFRLARKLKGLKKSSFRSQWRYIVNIEPMTNMEMRCITTANPSGLYLFGKNFNVTHNTAQGFAQMKAQALGRLGLIWGAIQRMVARMYYQAALCAAQNPDHDDEVTLPGDGNETVTVSLGNIRKGHFGAYPDEDSSFPESTPAKRATMTGLVTMAAQSPVGAAMFEEPDNWEVINELMGLPELVLPQAQARDKQMAEIEELLKEAPIPPDPMAVEEWQIQHAAAEVAAQAGAPPAPPMPPPQPKSSVPVDEFDYHQYEFEKCKSWLSSKACRDQLKAGNQEGVMNVKLHAKEHQAFLAAAAAAQMMAAAPPAPAPQAPHASPEVHKVAASAPPGAPAPSAGPATPAAA